MIIIQAYVNPHSSSIYSLISHRYLCWQTVKMFESVYGKEMIKWLNQMQNKLLALLLVKRPLCFATDVLVRKLSLLQVVHYHKLSPKTNKGSSSAKLPPLKDREHKLDYHPAHAQTNTIDIINEFYIFGKRKITSWKGHSNKSIKNENNIQILHL